MKVLFKTFAYTAMASLAFSSCGDSTNDSETSSSSYISSSSSVQRSSFCENPQEVEGEMPVMDCRVVSYKEYIIPEPYGKFITDEDTLKLWFPHIFDEKKKNTNCNYFAITIMNSCSYIYHILSQDMILYEIIASDESSCLCISMPVYQAMLVCDDTAEGNLKDNIEFNYASIAQYRDPNWDCTVEGAYDRGAFF